MASNEFLQFAGGSGANVVTDAQWAALLASGGANAAGFVAGIATSAQVNKALRQTSAWAAVLGQIVVDQLSVSTTDSDGTPTLEANLITALNKAIIALGFVVPYSSYRSSYSGIVGNKYGYRIEPDGFIRQIGFITKSGNGQPGIFQPSFPITFPSQVTSIGASIANTTNAIVTASVDYIDTTKMGVYTTNDYSVYWWAEGY